MCFHSKLSKKAQDIESRFDAKFNNIKQYTSRDNINGFAFPKTPVIANLKRDIIQQFSWGLIPFWAKDNTIRKYTLNAKIETLHEKPSFRNVMDNRCLVITDGFYEWQWLDPKGKQKQKYLITFPENQLFTFGGIWSEWVEKVTGEIVNSYSIVTTEANTFMAEIHNSKKRMPVILTKENETRWLDGETINTFKKPKIDLVAIAIK
ncbi:MAG: SOS response-associated peptidase [Flavobacteriaceae bacterium]|nr:SOS response-associated peptidase [Flavobacteriaceae bacterium]